MNDDLDEYGATLKDLYPDMYRHLKRNGHGPFGEPVDRMLRFVRCKACKRDVFCVMSGMYVGIGSEKCAATMFCAAPVHPLRLRWWERLKIRLKIDR